MNCSAAKKLMSSYLDGCVTRSQLAQMNEHVRACAGCGGHFAALQQTQSIVGSLGRKSPPPDLALRLRVALSQEIANSRRSRWERLVLRWDNAFNAIMVPATGGLVTTLIIFGMLISFLYYPAQVRASNDVPTVLYTPAQLQSTPFELTMGVTSAESLVVEAYVGPDGRVQDYRILSAPEEAQAVLPQLKNMLIFTTFQPATAFGQPTSGRVILTFSKVQVKG
ncbi:MAG TPA: zf-HC2 domain-containing protein [Terriglobales bacterium]|nr:zf-HC2 domain-containing protein [Terriglobales bacterium]